MINPHKPGEIINPFAKTDVEREIEQSLIGATALNADKEITTCAKSEPVKPLTIEELSDAYKKFEEQPAISPEVFERLRKEGKGLIDALSAMAPGVMGAVVGSGMLVKTQMDNARRIMSEMQKDKEAAQFNYYLRLVYGMQVHDTKINPMLCVSMDDDIYPPIEIFKSYRMGKKKVVTIRRKIIQKLNRRVGGYHNWGILNNGFIFQCKCCNIAKVVKITEIYPYLFDGNGLVGITKKG